MKAEASGGSPGLRPLATHAEKIVNSMPEVDHGTDRSTRRGDKWD